MGSAGFVLAINLCLGLVFALAFAVVGSFDRAHSSARWFAIAYGIGACAIVTELLLPFGIAPRLLYIAGFACYLSALLSVVVGFSRRYGAQPTWVVLGVVLGLSVVGMTFLYEMPRNSLPRMFGYQGPLALAYGLAAGVILRHGRKAWADRIIAGGLTFAALHNLAKPFIAMIVGGTGSSAAHYADTLYAAISQAVGGMVALSLGLMVLLVYMWDIVSDIREDSLTDPLTGLFNRRGFSQKVREWLRDPDHKAVPSAVVLADLDYFKLINDSYGHSAGDHVIEAFARLLRNASAVDYVLGRAGGEEFVIFLPRANGAAARLFSEAVRDRFSQLQISDLPADYRLSASFGVAEVSMSEDLASAIDWADDALIQSKALRPESRGAGRRGACGGGTSPAGAVQFQCKASRLTKSISQGWISSSSLSVTCSARRWRSSSASHASHEHGLVPSPTTPASGRCNSLPRNAKASF